MCYVPTLGLFPQGVNHCSRYESDLEPQTKVEGFLNNVPHFCLLAGKKKKSAK